MRLRVDVRRNYTSRFGGRLNILLTSVEQYSILGVTEPW
jgi:hypothetical protein